MAIMKNDSSYGTAGVWANTHNPWNVWNTDNGSTKDFGTWEAWVDAVAQNLKYRIEEYQKAYTGTYPTIKALADNVWPDGKWFLPDQGNYLKDNTQRMWAYMTDKAWGTAVQSIATNLVADAKISNQENLA